MSTDFKFSLKIKDKTIKYRKWKVKDKKKFLSDKNNMTVVREALVYDCLEDSKICLSEEEYNFVLFNIREQSLDDKITYVFECPSCSEEFSYDADLTLVMKPEFKKAKEIDIDGHTFVLSEIRNKEFYEKTVSVLTDNEEINFSDFILHIDSYNDQNYSFDDMIEIFNNMDIDIFESIYTTWNNIKFKVNNRHDVQCPKCDEITTMEFDALPGFFPDSWNV